MNLVDSCGWLEYYADGPNADFFAPALEEPGALVVPTITLLEVFKIVLRQHGEDDALRMAALMQQGRLIDLTAPLALAAADIGRRFRLPLADSVILAAASPPSPTCG